jgi:hypothetical protein
MKIMFIALGAALLMASCQGSPKQTETAADSAAMKTDTAGLAAYNAFKAQVAQDSLKKVQDSIATAQQAAAAKAQPAKKSSRRSSSGTAYRSNAVSSGTTTEPETISSESANTAEQKKGWSKTAKGAVIGGVVGAGAGAVINKKNRTKGAIIGGAAGAGAGAIIGHDQDKRDGRH